MSISLQNITNNGAKSKTTYSWQSAVEKDLQRVTAAIQDVSFLNNDLLDGAIKMIVQGGGKRMRPAITLLIGRATSADDSHLIDVAASIELLHTATLVHDDLIDGAEERRGVQTMHSQLPLGITVLTGDFLFAQSAALAARANNVEIVKTFSDTLVAICRGEILQAQTRWQVTSRDVYDERIYGKTAALFEAAAISAGLLSKVSAEDQRAYAKFGRELGMAFQIVDDALDFVGTTEKLGKPAGHDLRQGIITLPALLYLEENDIDHNEFVEQIRTEDGVELAVQSIREQEMPQRALAVAHDYLRRGDKLLQSVNAVAKLDELRQLADYVAARDY